MKPTPINSRLLTQQGSVLSHVLSALGGVVVGFVVAIIGGGLLAAFVIPTLSLEHEKSRATAASAAARQGIADKDADAASEQVAYRSPARTANDLATLSTAAREATAKRNAQALASVFAAGEAAGVDWTAHDVDSAVRELVSGGTPKTGPFAGKLFYVPNRSTNDLQPAKAYLRWNSDTGTLSYISKDAYPSN